MKKLLVIPLALILASVAFAQKERKFVREGNGYYNDGLKDTTKLDTINFGKAEVAYRRALELKPEDFHWQFNLANSIYKQNKPQQSATEFEKLSEKTTIPAEKSMVYHNLGNSLLAEKKFDPSIDSYKKALRITPNDPETKYNLAYAMKMKKKDQEQKKKDQDQKKKDQDKNKDKNKNDQKKDKDKDKDNQDQNKNQQSKDQQQKQQPQNKISKQSAEQMLQALENDEKQTQEKVKKAQALKAERTKVEKNW